MDQHRADFNRASIMWKARSGKNARMMKSKRVGMCFSEMFVDLEIGVCDARVSVRDVLPDGNCLYYAVYQSAAMQAILHPFGLRATAHVNTLRFHVAMKVCELMQSNRLVVNDTWENVGSLVAEPGQYMQYSGCVPMMAMAEMLRRTIVTISFEGIASVCPHDYCAFMNEEELGPPIVVYHCQAGNIRGRVPWNQRNHYAAVRVVDSESMWTLVKKYREGGARLDFTDDIPDRSQRFRTRKRMLVPMDIHLPNKKQRQVKDTPKTIPKLSQSPDDTSCKRKPYHVCDLSSASEQDGELLNDLCSRANEVTELGDDELRVLASGQNYTRCPRLARLFFHCCSNDPRAYVFNDESLIEPKSTQTIKRLNEALDGQVGMESLNRIYSEAHNRSSSTCDIHACASCCEIVITTEERGKHIPIQDLHHNFKLTDDEFSQYMKLPQWVRVKYVQAFCWKDTTYHLNPDLVGGVEAIYICTRCLPNPRDFEYSIASGHDYGRVFSLPELNDVSTACISPVRVFGSEISLDGKHVTGHSICFPSNGPIGLANVLPHVDVEDAPRVTFIGPGDQWRKDKKKYSNLYAVDVEGIFAWMRVLQKLHSGFRENQIEFDYSDKARAALLSFGEFVDKNVIVDESAETADLVDCANGDPNERGENFEGGQLVCSSSAVLKQGEQGSTDTSIIDTMLDLRRKHDTGTVLPIRRSRDPVVEWTNNGQMIACAFPALFLLGGNALPHGSWPQKLVRHLMRYYDGRFEKNTKFIALLFNQLQRHAAVRRAAKVGASNNIVLERFGALVNSEEFEKRLEHAQANPSTHSTKRLTASLLRLISLVGGSVPFSPFERVAARPKITALRLRYGVPQHWLTMAPPEHDDLILQRIAMLRQLSAWNDMTSIFSRRECSFSDFPHEIQACARSRLAIANRYPALAVDVFERKMSLAFDVIIGNPRCGDRRVSRHYGERPSGAYGKIASHGSVVEPQTAGRLHAHVMLYGSAMNPEILTRISIAPALRNRVVSWLESVCCTSLDPSVHQWRQGLLDAGEKLPRPHEVSLPTPSCDMRAFHLAAQRRLASTNFHVHSTTCFKTARGKYMCRLARPAGVHDQETCPVLIARVQHGDDRKGVRPILQSHNINEATAKLIDAGYNPDKEELFRQELPYPLLWELRRPREDTHFVETNVVLGGILASHTNSTIIAGEDAGDAVEQYQQAYMTKDGQSLRFAIPVLMGALKHVREYPSRAEDRDLNVRRGKYLAARTVNSFTGGHEWSLSTMVYALYGHKAFESSDSFWYIYPWVLVGLISRDHSMKDYSSRHVPAQVSVDETIQELVEMAHNDNEHTYATQHRGGTRSFTVDGRVVFLSQLESYRHRGTNFQDYSLVEFECIIDILPKRTSTVKSKGRPTRPGFPFAATHPLFGSHEGYIRAKMHTPIFGGAPSPRLRADPDLFARYVLAAFCEWDTSHFRPSFSLNISGLCELCKQWDKRCAPLILRQRYRYIRNMMNRGVRNNAKEQVLTEWRNRNVDIWKFPRDQANEGSMNVFNKSTDAEKDGVLDTDVDLFALTQSLTSTRSTKSCQLKAFQARLKSIMTPTQSPNDGATSSNMSMHGVIQITPDVSFRALVNRIHDYVPDGEDLKDGSNAAHGGQHWHRNMSAELAPDQLLVWEHIVSSLSQGSPRDQQTLTLLHGGGGTGKSHLVRLISEEVHRRGFDVVSTCPTGAGACQLLQGNTVHSTFKVGRSKHISVHAMEMLRQTFSQDLALVVVDEVSMLSAEMLAMMDTRLRELYDGNKVFGGVSILLVGDFLQLQVVRGTSLCSLLYTTPTKPDLCAAQALFKQFRVMFLNQQQRASGCPSQQQLLQSFRTLPEVYPNSDKWDSTAQKVFQPIQPDSRALFTKHLEMEDVCRDALWCEESVILVTGNLDRVVANHCMARILADRSGVLLYRWKRTIVNLDAHLESIRELLYDEDERPTLYGYFFKNAFAQILDNGNGNVSMGIANGTACRYHSMAWDDVEKTLTVVKLSENALKVKERVVDLPFPPEFINVILLDRNRLVVPKTTWPLDANLASEEDGDCVVIPIGISSSSNERFVLKLPASVHHNEMHFVYEHHAVDLAMALTTWKAQGSTFKRVILHLQGSTSAPSWTFEHLYVALSRVCAADHIRCIPLSSSYNQDRLLKMLPNINTVKWRMDINNDGYWQQRDLDAGRYAYAN